MSSKLRRKVLVGILVLALIISVGLNWHSHFIVLSQMQATINNMRIKALDAWLGKMETVRNILRRAETNIDVEDAQVHTSWANLFVGILTNGIDLGDHQNELYYWISRATFHLDQALQRIYSGNQTGVITERYLDQNVLTMIGNVTTNIENMYGKSSFLQISLPNGVEPTQQLRDAGVLTDVLNHLEQIYQVSDDMLDYYR